MTLTARSDLALEGDAESPWTLRRGATVSPDGTTFSVWAPKAPSVTVHVATGDGAGEYPLVTADGHRGMWHAAVPGVRPGDRYGYRLDGGDPLPDPVSRSQPDGVHGLSRVIDPHAFTWSDSAWRGVALADVVIYELHVGTFTPEGTFDAIVARLPELAALGVTVIELMPVASFPGRRNWGYDDVHLYAPQWSYGEPDALRRLVDAAHQHGLGVMLDVVYNHVGPEGSSLDRFGPYFTDVYRTPWGRAMNYDGPGSDGVRRWAHDNALYWVSEFHIDALRLDAVQGIYDFGAFSFLEQLSDEVHELSRRLGRKVQLIAESDQNDPRLVQPPEHGGYGLDAQWADDVHHTIHTTLTGETNGYYQDFCGIATMADVYREPFFYSRRYAVHRDRTHGRSSSGVPRQRFVVSAQNHDQVGNRPNGERLASLVGPDRLRLAAALVLLSPYVPLLFMGEEYGETTPFLYFIEHGDAALIDAVRAGRSREFEAIGNLASPTDPQSDEAFLRSRIDWPQRANRAGAQLLSLYRDVLALRREEPALRPGATEVQVEGDAAWLTTLRVMPLQYDRYDGYDGSGSRPAVLCTFNLSEKTMHVPVHADAIGGWKHRLSTDAVAYGGTGAEVGDLAPAVSVTADAPKRLIEPREPPRRTVRLPAWSAAVFVRDLDSMGVGAFPGMNEWAGR